MSLEVTGVALSVSMVLLFAVLVLLLIKKAGLKALHAAVCVLFGFYLASTNMAPAINDASQSVANMISDINF